MLRLPPTHIPPSLSFSSFSLLSPSLSYLISIIQLRPNLTISLSLSFLSFPLSRPVTLSPTSSPSLSFPHQNSWKIFFHNLWHMPHGGAKNHKSYGLVWIVFLMLSSSTSFNLFYILESRICSFTLLYLVLMYVIFVIKRNKVILYLVSC